MATSPPAERDAAALEQAGGCAARLFAAGEWLVERPKLLAILAGLGAVHGFFASLGTFSFLITSLALAGLWNVAKRHGRYRYGFLFALAYFIPISHWLGVFVGRWTGSPVLYGLAWGFVALGLAIPLAAIVPLAGWLFRRRAPWLIPFAWIGLEVFRSYVPVLAFPWGQIAHPAAADELGGVLGLLGEYGTGGLIVFASVWMASWEGEGTEVRERPRYGLALAGALIVAVLAYERFHLPARPNLVLAAAQPGLDLAYGPYARPGPGRNLALAERIRAARADQQRLNADLVVLPEGLISSSDPSDLPKVEGPGTLLLGGQRKEGKTAYQTAFAFDGQTGKWESADKTRLVIFGEFVPGRGVIPYPPSFALPGGDLAAASELRMIDAHARDGRPFRVGPILCFEALFPDIAYRQKLRGADVLAVMSLDDWFADTKAPEWLEWAARWRAAETGLPTVRVGSMGFTSVIDGRGNVRARVPWGENRTVAHNPAAKD